MNKSQRKAKLAKRKFHQTRNAHLKKSLVIAETTLTREGANYLNNAWGIRTNGICHEFHEGDPVSMMNIPSDYSHQATFYSPYFDGHSASHEKMGYSLASKYREHLLYLGDGDYVNVN